MLQKKRYENNHEQKIIDCLNFLKYLSAIADIIGFIASNECKKMDVNNRLLNSLVFDDDDIEIVVILIFWWRNRTSHLSNWLLRNRLTLQRIARERRIGMTTFINDVLPQYHNIQFREHFRMSRATFEVKPLFKCY